MFELGQKVVCLGKHPQGLLKDGEIYTVKDLMLCPKCKHLAVDVGVKQTYIGSGCHCGQFISGHENCWFSHTRFRPLDDLYNEELNEELSEIFTKQPFET